MHGHIEFQVSLVDSAKRSQIITQSSPKSLDGIGVDFLDSIAIVVPGPFFFGMTDGMVRARGFQGKLSISG